MTFHHTRLACYAGFITQAIVINLAPLLFIVFQTQYQLDIEKLGRLVLLNFLVQLVTDIVAVPIVDKVGYRRPMILAHVLCTLGLVLLALAPAVMPSPYLGLTLGIVVYAVGGGLLEVLISPVVEALPSPQEGKAAAMSLLHSFYCWGQVAVVVGTTLLLSMVGHGSWQLIPLLWAVLPVANLINFMRVPMPDTVHEAHRMSIRDLLSRRTFALFLVLMLCTGASELTMVQWSSLFAERGLGVDKVLGDFAGPALFSVFMGLGRFLYGMFGEKVPLAPTMVACGLVCAACYFTVSVAANPVVSLLACALCGLSVSLMWPGTLSLAAGRFPLGGAAMFGMLAVFGDLGGSIGPWFAGFAADAGAAGKGLFASILGVLPADGETGLRVGILLATVFPLVLGLALLANRKRVLPSYAVVAVNDEIDESSAEPATATSGSFVS